MIKNLNKVTNNEKPSLTPPPCELDTSPHCELDDSEIDAFCRDIIRWKATIIKNEEINKLFNENPSYLFGFLTYRMILSEKANKKIQFSIVSLTLALTILAFGVAAMTYYQSMGKSEFPFIAIIYLVISVPIFYIFLKLRPLLKNYSLSEETKK